MGPQIELCAVSIQLVEPNQILKFQFCKLKIHYKQLLMGSSIRDGRYICTPFLAVAKYNKEF